MSGVIKPVPACPVTWYNLQMNSTFNKIGIFTDWEHTPCVDITIHTIHSSKSLDQSSCDSQSNFLRVKSRSTSDSSAWTCWALTVFMLLSASNASLKRKNSINTVEARIIGQLDIHSEHISIFFRIGRSKSVLVVGVTSCLRWKIFDFLRKKFDRFQGDYRQQICIEEIWWRNLSKISNI